MEQYTWIVPCLFGLEGLVVDEIRDLGCEVQAENGRVKFIGSMEDMARVNLWMRCGERVLLQVGQWEAHTFDQLFEGTKALPWEQFISRDGEFPVKGHSLNSDLHSVPDCQAIIKKAIAARLGQAYHLTWLPEDQERYQVQFSIMKNQVTLMIDTSGEGLHKRGYRKDANAAPLRETLAAAMVKLARFRIQRPFVDPTCGSGTIAIEAALMGTNRAPGMNRSFSFEYFQFFDRYIMEKLRQEARDAVKEEPFVVGAFDIDPKCVSLTTHNAGLAGVGRHVKAAVQDVAKLRTKTENGIIVCNPPYGERLMEKKEAEQLYVVMGKSFSALPGWQYYILSSHEGFEQFFGRKADKKRKLYNGMIKCDFYQYFRRLDGQPRLQQTSAVGGQRGKDAAPRRGAQHLRRMNFKRDQRER